MREISYQDSEALSLGFTADVGAFAGHSERWSAWLAAVFQCARRGPKTSSPFFFLTLTLFRSLVRRFALTLFHIFLYYKTGKYFDQDLVTGVRPTAMSEPSQRPSDTVIPIKPPTVPFLVSSSTAWGDFISVSVDRYPLLNAKKPMLIILNVSV